MGEEEVAVPVTIAVLLVAIVGLLLICKCREERKREREFKRLQDEFDHKLGQMHESHHSSMASDTAPPHWG